MFDSEAKASIVRVHPQAAAGRRDRSRTRELLTGPATSIAAERERLSTPSSVRTRPGECRWSVVQRSRRWSWQDCMAHCWTG